MRFALGIGVLAAFALGACAGPATPAAQTSAQPTAATLTPTPRPVAVLIYGQFVERLNGGDIPGAVALLTEDVVHKGGKSCTPSCGGKAAVTAALRGATATHTQVVVVAGTVGLVGDRLTSREEARADNFRAAGAERVILLKTYDFRGDQISFIQTDLDLSDPQTAAFGKSLPPPTASPTPGY